MLASEREMYSAIMLERATYPTSDAESTCAEVPSAVGLPREGGDIAEVYGPEHEKREVQNAGRGLPEDLPSQTEMADEL